MQSNTKVTDFISAVWEQWKVLVSGGAGIVLLLSLVERASGKGISWHWYVVLLSLLVFWACYIAWKKERQELNRVKNELKEKYYPQLKGMIRQVSVGKLKSPTNLATITVIASIRNLGMQSIVTRWSLLVKVPDKGLFHGVLQHIEGRIISYQQGHPPVIHQQADLLYNKLAEQPLLTGGEVTGVLVFHLEGVAKEDVFRTETIMVLTFEDVAERTYFDVHIPFGEVNVPKYFPGMKSSATKEALVGSHEYNLTLEVDAYATNTISLRYDQRFIGLQQEGIKICAIRGVFRMRFINHDRDPLSVIRMRVSLIRANEDGSEQQIPQIGEEMTSISEDTGQQLDLENTHILGSRITPYYQLYCHLIIAAMPVEEFKKGCFIRITMEAMRQPPYPVDLDVADWERATTGDGTTVTPRTSAQYQAHRSTE